MRSADSSTMCALRVNTRACVICGIGGSGLPVKQARWAAGMS